VQELLSEIEREVAVCPYESIEEFKRLLSTHLAAAIPELSAPWEPPDTNGTPKSLVFTRLPFQLPQRLVPRDRYLSRVSELLKGEASDSGSGGMCVLLGDSGSGKSILAGRYYDSVATNSKRWVICKSTLLPYAAGIDLSEASLLVLDGFEDQKFCWDVLARRPRSASLIATVTDPDVAQRILRELGSAGSSRCIVRIPGLDSDEWSQALRGICADFPPLVLNALCGRFLGSAAGLQLLMATLARDANPKRTLNRIRAALEETGLLAEEDKLAHRYAPAPYVAYEWWKQSGLAGTVMRILASIPLTGMSARTLADLLKCNEAEIETTLDQLYSLSFVYPLHFGTEELWVALDYFRDAFEAINWTIREADDLERCRRHYVSYCESKLQGGLLGKLDSAFVQASRAFEGGDLRSVTDALDSCRETDERLRRAQLIEASCWIPISNAIAKRARLCNQVIPVAEAISYSEPPQEVLGDLAWRLAGTGDFLGDSTAILAAIGQWRNCRDPEAKAELIQSRLRQLVSTDEWFGSHVSNQWADMLPTILLAGLGEMGFEERVEAQLEDPDIRRRFPRSTFLHAVSIIRAADRGASDSYRLARRLISRHWKAVRNTPVKQFVLEYLEHVCAINLQQEPQPVEWQSPYDPRYMAGQLALSARALGFLDTKRRIRSSGLRDDKSMAILRGNCAWFSG
jgi:hypothetical protein